LLEQNLDKVPLWKVLDLMNKKIIEGLSAISPQAVEFVQNFGARVIWQDPSGAPDCVVQSALSDMGLIYASLSCQAPQTAWKIAHDALMALIADERFGERCFNCRGDDTQSRRLALSLGFKLVMAGYFMELEPKSLTAPALPGLRIYQAQDLEAWRSLLTESYRELCLATGVDPETSLQDKDAFARDMLQRSAHNEAWSFVLDGKLVAGFRLRGAFIEDLVVLPEHQNRGLGTALLDIATAQVLAKGQPKVCLRVVESNLGAFRLYQRKNFSLLSYFAEHDFAPGSQ
jgi:ribosomal protein S18 acetylase RimI-like enzyme